MRFFKSYDGMPTQKFDKYFSHFVLSVFWASMTWVMLMMCAIFAQD